MKMQAELNNVINRFKKIAERIPAHAEKLRQSGNYKDFKTRLAWDCLYAVYSASEICEWYDKYNVHDQHITTLAKKALDQVYPI